MAQVTVVTDSVESSGVEWADITDTYRVGFKSMPTGEFLLAEGFTLQDSMVCLAISDPKTDLSLSGKVALTVDEAFKLHGLPRRLSSFETLHAVNGLLCYLVDWLNGGQISATLCRCLFLHRPRLAWECSDELGLFVSYVLRIAAMVRQVVVRADIYREEDFIISSCGLNLHTLSSIGQDDGFATCGALAKRCRAAEVRLVRAVEASRGVSEVEDPVGAALSARLSMIRCLFNLHHAFNRFTVITPEWCESVEQLAASMGDCLARADVEQCHEHCRRHAGTNEQQQPAQPVPQLAEDESQPTLPRDAEELMRRQREHFEKKAVYNGGFDADVALLLCGTQQQVMFFAPATFPYGNTTASSADFVGEEEEKEEKKNFCTSCISLQSALRFVGRHSQHLRALCGMARIGTLAELTQFVQRFSERSSEEQTTAAGQHSQQRPVPSRLHSPFPAEGLASLPAGRPDLVCFSMCLLLTYTGGRVCGKHAFKDLVLQDLRIAGGVDTAVLETADCDEFVNRIMKMVLRWYRIQFSNPGRQRRMLVTQLEFIGELQEAADLEFLALRAVVGQRLAEHVAADASEQERENRAPGKPHGAGSSSASPAAAGQQHRPPHHSQPPPSSKRRRRKGAAGGGGVSRGAGQAGVQIGNSVDGHSAGTPSNGAANEVDGQKITRRLSELLTEEYCMRNTHHLALWILDYALLALARFVSMGFPLQLYESSELVVVFWHLDCWYGLRSKIASDALARLVALDASGAGDVAGGGGGEEEPLGGGGRQSKKTKKRAQAHSAVHAAMLRTRATLCKCDGLKFACRAAFQLISLLSESDRLRSPLLPEFYPLCSLPYGSPALRYNMRFQAMSFLSHPAPLTWAAFEHQFNAHCENSARAPQESLALVTQSLQQSRLNCAEVISMATGSLAGVEAADLDFPSMKEVVRFCIGNTLVVTHLSRALQRALLAQTAAEKDTPAQGGSKDGGVGQSSSCPANFGLPSHSACTLQWEYCPSLPVVKISQ